MRVWLTDAEPAFTARTSMRIILSSNLRNIPCNGLTRQKNYFEWLNSSTASLQPNRPELPVILNRPNIIMRKQAIGFANIGESTAWRVIRNPNGQI